jgi:hypothetical protein
MTGKRAHPLMKAVGGRVGMIGSHRGPVNKFLRASLGVDRSKRFVMHQAPMFCADRMCNLKFLEKCCNAEKKLAMLRRSIYMLVERKTVLRSVKGICDDQSRRYDKSV